MYIQGKQYASNQWYGNQIKCTEGIFRIDDIDVNNGIRYGEEALITQETTLITNGEFLKDTNNNRILNCTPVSEECYYNEEIYVWLQRRPKCIFYELMKASEHSHILMVQDTSLQMTV